MKAIEFRSKIRENQILIPHKIQPKLITKHGRSVRMIIFMNDSEVYDDQAYRQITQKQFLNGYADSDSIYDL
jgi:hypothetical protein